MNSLVLAVFAAFAVAYTHAGVIGAPAAYAAPLAAPAIASYAAPIAAPAYASYAAPIAAPAYASYAAPIAAPLSTGIYSSRIIGAPHIGAHLAAAPYAAAPVW